MNKIVVLTIFSLLMVFTSLNHAAPNARIVGGVESLKNDWGFMSALMYRRTQVNIQDQSFPSLYMIGSAPTLFSGPLVSCDKGFTICHDAKDSICLIERGITFFYEKIQNCESGGGIGAIVYNNEEGFFGATLGDYIASIPAVSISRGSGLALLSYLNQQVNLSDVDEVPSTSFCGATYIGGKWAITAAHCVDDVPSQSLVLNMGGHDLETDQNNIVDILKAHIHPAYNRETIENDIALLELASIPEGISAVEIPDSKILETAINKNAKVTALGRGVQDILPSGDFGLDSESVSTLFQIDVNLTSSDACNDALNNFFADDTNSTNQYITNDMMCAGELDEGEGVCFGDSGGPLILQQDNKNYLLGVVSWVPGCAQQGVYDVYSNVPYFKSDIENFINGKSTSFGGDVVNKDDNKTWYSYLDLWCLLLLSSIFAFRIGSLRR